MKKFVKNKYIIVTISMIVIFLALQASAYFCWPEQGCTGIDTIPTAGQILIGTSEGIYEPSGVLSVVTSTGVITFNSAFSFPAADGTSNQILKTNGSGTLTWAADATGAGGGSADAGGYDGQVQYNNGGTSLGGASMLYYDDTNDRVGIGENEPAAVLEVSTAGGSDPFFMITSSTDGDILTVDSAGDVGINDSTPDYNLEVLDVITQFAITHTDTVDYAEFYVNSDGDLRIYPSSGEILFNSANITAGDITANYFYGDGSNLTGVGAVSATALTITAKAAENITKGQVVYISGATGNKPQVSLADNTDSTKHFVTGMAAETKTTGQTILVRVRGEITGIDTSSFSAGDTIYLSTGGGIVNVAPTSGAVELIGYVEYSHANQGEIVLIHHSAHNITVPSGEDTMIRMGDSAGANKISFRGYDNNEVATMDSDGMLTITTMTDSTIYIGYGEITGAVSITSTSFIGALTGNATTATALAANGGNCAAGQAPLGVDASGAVESCFDVWTEAENTSAAYWNALTDMVLTDNYIYVGDASNDPVGVAMSNDCTIASNGAITCDHDALDNFLANEHLDWTGDLGAVNIHTGNYPITDSEVPDNITIDLATLASTITVADESADTENFLAFFTTATGSLAAKTGTNLTFNSSTGVLTATGFVGALTGNSSTATALADNGANCNAGEYALGVDASGAVENCTDATTEINSVVNGLGGTNLTCAAQSCNVDDKFITNDASDTMVGTLTVTTLTNGIWTLPDSDGTNGQFITTDGSGNLSWATSSGSGDITDVFNCSTGDCSSIIAGAADLLDMGSAVSFEIPNVAGDLTLDATGEIGLDSTQKQLGIYDGTVEVAIPLRHIIKGEVGTGDYDADPDVKIMNLNANVFPDGIVITEWLVDCNEADPTTELNANIYYADDVGTGAFPGGNAVLVDVIDTTTGNSAENDMSNSDLGSGTIPTGKDIYILIDADLVSDTTLFTIEIYFYIPES